MDKKENGQQTRKLDMERKLTGFELDRIEEKMEEKGGFVCKFMGKSCN